MPAVKTIIFFLIFSFFTSSVFAADIVINEFSSASNPEWVELYNPTDQTISLKKTTLIFDAKTDTSQKVSFCEADQITAKSFKLVNRPEKSYWLSNDGDTLILKREDDSIDTITFGTGQTVKSPTTTQSVVRLPDGSSNWVVSDQPNPQGEIASFDCPAPVTETAAPITVVPTPKIDWALENKIYVAKEFKTTKLELSNFDLNTEYFLKFRAGTEEGKLTKIQTKNGNAYLSDSESWSKFPLIKTDENSKWTGEIKGLLGEGKPDGEYKIQLRIRKKDTDTYFESDIKIITFLPEIKEIILPSSSSSVASAVVLKPVKTASKPAEVKPDEPSILGTQSANVETIVPPQKKLGVNWPSLFLFSFGAILSVGAVWSIIQKTTKNED